MHARSIFVRDCSIILRAEDAATSSKWAECVRNAKLVKTPALSLADHLQHSGANTQNSALVPSETTKAFRTLAGEPPQV